MQITMNKEELKKIISVPRKRISSCQCKSGLGKG